MSTSTPQSRYYLRVKDNPLYKEKRRLQAQAYRDRVRHTPEYKEKQRMWGRDRYKRDKENPELMKKIRARTLRYTQAKREKYQEVRKQLQALLGSKCSRCPVTDYRLLDFDHIDPTTKTMNLSQKLHLNWEILVKETKKCQLLCANCHRLKTLEEKEHDTRKTREFRNPKKPSFPILSH